MKILITGGTGFIGQYIIPGFLNKNYEVIVLTRNPSQAKKVLPNGCTIIGDLSEISKEMPIKGIINLAGEPIDGKRWSSKQKKELVNSRLGVTQQCVDLIKRLEQKPSWFISGSAIGYYGAQEDGLLPEEAKPAPSFTHHLCQQWEQCALRAKAFQVRVCLLRIGVVLGRNGGALKRMVPPFKWGIGGRLGHGKQWFSWIHQEDIRKIIMTLIEDSSYSGPVNATSPNPVTNQQLTTILAKTLHRPVFFPVPGFMIKALYGEMGQELLLKGQRVVPKKMLTNGFEFQYPNLSDALHDILAK